MDRLSEYLAMENGALTRKLAEYEIKIRQMQFTADINEELLNQAERRIHNMEEDFETLNEKWHTMSQYAKWLEVKVQGPIIGRAFPRSALRYVFERGSNQVTLIYKGERWFTNDMVRWHPLIDLTTDEELEGESD